jgi:hypothetical protein
LGLLAPAVAPLAWSQEQAFVPRIEATAAWDSNRLLSDRAQSGETYDGLLSVDWYRLSPRNDFEIIPQLTLEESSFKALDTWQAQVDFREHYLMQKADLLVTGQYYRQDAYNSEYGEALFNPLNPESPDPVGSGVVVTGITRTSYQVAPTLNYSFTPRLGADVDLKMAAVRYSTDIAGALVSFNAPSAQADLNYGLTQRTDASAGLFFTQYDPTQDDALKSNSYGFQLGARHAWSQETRTSLELQIGRNVVDEPFGAKKTATAIGVQWNGSAKWQTSSITYRIGRFLEPSSLGGEIAVSQIRVQYTKAYTQRLSFTGALRAARIDQLGETGTNRTRIYGQLFAHYAITRNIYMSAGYNFGWQQIPAETHTSDNHGAFFTLGYQGNEPARR